jgi:hypothetical protein
VLQSQPNEWPREWLRTATLGEILDAEATHRYPTSLLGIYD